MNKIQPLSGRFLKHKEGHVPNPLTGASYRNRKCPCQSGLKAKKCCGRFFSVLPGVKIAIDKVCAAADRNAAHIKAYVEVINKARSAADSVKANK